MVNDVVGRAASQEMSVSLTGGAVNLSPKIKEAQDRELDRSLPVKAASELEVSQLIDKAGKQRLAVDILKPFVGKLAEAGIALGIRQTSNERADQKLRDFAEREGLTEDKVEISSTDTQIIAQIKGLKRQNDQQARNFSGGRESEETLALLKEYAAAFMEQSSGVSPELSARLKELRQQLLARGISEAKLQSLESSLKNGTKTDLLQMLQEAVVQEHLASSPIEKMISRRGLNVILERLDPAEAKTLLAEAADKAKGELRGFVLEELENTLIKKTLLQDQDFTEAIKLLEVGEKAGLDYSKWMNEVWLKKKDDHGLYLIDVPDAAIGLNVNTSTDHSGGEPPKHGFEYEKKDENEVLINRLRALYMQRALKGDLATRLKTEFKIRKLKNGLMKLGIFTKDLEERVEHEAELVAKIKIIEMLKEALVERATFYDLAGPAYELVEKKIKGLLRNAERLSLPISVAEFNNLRDQANRRVFEISKRELDEVVEQRGLKDSDKLLKKEKMLLRLLARLKEESQIEASFASFS